MTDWIEGDAVQTLIALGGLKVGDEVRVRDLVRVWAGDLEKTPERDHPPFTVIESQVWKVTAVYEHQTIAEVLGDDPPSFRVPAACKIETGTLCGRWVLAPFNIAAWRRPTNG